MLRSVRHFSAKAQASVNSKRILAQALPLVPQHGWEDSIVEASRANGMSDQGTSLFSKTDLVAFHYDEELKALQKFEPKAEKPFERLHESSMYRLGGNTKLGAHRLAEAIASTVRERAIARSTGLSASVADEIWYKAGDRSTDTQWYTRRGSLLGVYAALETFQSRDTSSNMRDTRASADKLVNGLATAEYVESSVSEWSNFNAHAAFNVSRTWR